ncbi:YecA family protein, partial [Ensifer sp. T173]|nr:YecA family protein [Ensifer canadensis]
WRPVLRGHAVTGDIIAPIRKLGEAKRKATSQDAADVAGALVSIRTYFMPKRAKQKF